MSYWGATVITNLFSAIPVFGQSIVTLLWGGFTVDNPTLVRFYSLHYLLPFVIVAVVFLHLIALHQHGSNDPLGIDKKAPQDSLPFHPYYTVKDLFGFCVFLLIYAALCLLHPEQLHRRREFLPRQPDADAPSHCAGMVLPPLLCDASRRSGHPFCPGQAGWRHRHVGSIFLLFLLPWLDTSRVRSARFRPIYKWVFWLLLFDCLVLGWVGGNPPEGKFILIGRVATLYYFVHFLVVLPLLSKFERPLPVPPSISEAVLKEAERRAVPAAGARETWLDTAVEV